MLQRLGMVIAMAGLIPACLLTGESRIAHKHFGEVLNIAATLLQQAGETLALASLVAARHGVSPNAADSTGVFPHSPAAPAGAMNPSEATRITNTATMRGVETEEKEAMIVKC